MNVTNEGMKKTALFGLIGYATPEGRIVIAPQYKCAYPFVKNSYITFFDETRITLMRFDIF